MPLLGRITSLLRERMQKKTACMNGDTKKIMFDKDNEILRKERNYTSTTLWNDWLWNVENQLKF